MSRQFEDQLVLVTGGAQGLGRAMVQRFVEEGAVVRFADLNDDPAAETVSATGGAAVYDRVDISDPDAARSWIDQAASDHGRLDVLVNNAGIIRDGRIENMSSQDWESVIGVSLTGTFNCTKAAFPYMKERSYGRVLSFASVSWRGNFGQVNYSAAKAGIVGFMRSFALEGARHGVTSNAISPGMISTPMLQSMKDEVRAKHAKRVPLGTIGDPADIASAAAFLCSAEAGYITGVVLDVDGGLSIGSSMR